MNVANATDEVADQEAGSAGSAEQEPGPSLKKGSRGVQIRRRIARGDWLYFVVAYVGLGIALGAVAFALLSYASTVARDQLTSRITQAETQAVNAMRREGETTLVDVTTDLLAFRDIADRALATSVAGDPGLSALSETMLDFMQHHRSYDQLRLLGGDGRERIRIDNLASGGRITPGHELQDKSDRLYVLQALDLPPNVVLISQLDANQERGQIEIPLKPVLRLVTKVPGRDDFVVLNYRARELMESIESIGRAAVGRPLIVTRRGAETLAALRVGTPEALLALQEVPDFGERYPGAWAVIAEQTQGSVDDGEGGIMVFRRFVPAETRSPRALGASTVRWTLPIPDGSRDEGGWILISHVDRQVLDSITDLGLTRSPLVRTIIAALILVIAGLGAYGLRDLRRRNYVMSEIAARDALTGICNRGEFDRRLKGALAHARRYKRAMALLVIDLNDFKAVNDSIGHAAGDKILRHVARTLQDNLRISDVVGRVGGDEFAVVLREIDSGSDAIAVVELLRERLKDTIPVAGNWVPISASVGGATFPDDATDIDPLFEAADKAMYEDKQRKRSRG